VFLKSKSLPKAVYRPLTVDLKMYWSIENQSSATAREEYIKQQNANFARAMDCEYEPFITHENPAWPYTTANADVAIPDFRAPSDWELRGVLEAERLPYDHSCKNITELKQTLKSRGLPHSYKKEKLLEHLHRSDRDRQYQQPPKIILTFQHVGFPLQMLPFEIRKMVYMELLNVHSTLSHHDYGDVLYRALKIRQGLPQEAFHMVQELNRFPVTINHYNTIRAVGSSFYVIVPEGKDSKAYRPVDTRKPDHWLQLPQILRECCHIDIELRAASFSERLDEEVLAREAESIKKMIMHLSTFVNVILRPNKNLKSVRLQLEFYTRASHSPLHEVNEKMKELEYRCLYTLVELRGLSAQGVQNVQFSGCKLVEEEHIQAVKCLITQPHPQPDQLIHLSR